MVALPQPAESFRPGHASLGAAAMDSNSCSTTACSGAAPGVEPIFRIDDLLIFPTEAADDEPAADAPAPPVHDPASVQPEDTSAAPAAGNDDWDGLCVPSDELVFQLEWLSSFSEDNLCLEGETKVLSCLTGLQPPSCHRLSSRTESRKTTGSKPTEAPSSHSPLYVLEQHSHSYTRTDGFNRVYKSYRVRKARSGGRIWSLDILQPLSLDNRSTGSNRNASLSMASNTCAQSESLCSLLQHNAVERPSKKAKPFNMDGDQGMMIRHCTHCFVQKTPQWRAGPQGPKTLCNACGVRYKSGRLWPEYRPAASPSFVNEVHSNSHRRILEMRRAKAADVFSVTNEKEMGREEESNAIDGELDSDPMVNGKVEERVDANNESKRQPLSVELREPSNLPTRCM